VNAPFDPTPFQRATIAAVMRMFEGKKQRRILVADEVGLGKTHVARGVIQATEQLRRREGDDLFKVVYVCGSQNIVRQNLSKLAPDRPEAYEETKSEESRLSMQHLLVAEGEAHKKAKCEFLQLMALTPGTSFRLAGSKGLKRERALICAMLGRMEEYETSGYALFQRLSGTNPPWHWTVSKNRGGPVTFRECLWGCGEDIPRGEWDWSDWVGYYDRRIEAASRSGYPINVLRALRTGKLQAPDHIGDSSATISFPEFMARMIAKPISESFTREIGILRRRFAEISAELLRPDLVILDEFQRFRYLIDPPDGDGGEVKVLFDRFLRSDEKEDDDPPRVLMLSATPFKLYTTSTEKSEFEGEDSFREFSGLLDFLFPDSTERATVWGKWQRYTRILSEAGCIVALPDEKPLLAEKARAEKGLRRAIFRTERSLADAAGDVSGPLVSPQAPIMPLPQEIRSYVAFSEWMRNLGIPERLPPEYAKSAPYLLSFLTGYKEQESLESALAGRTGELVLTTPSSVQRDLWLDRSTVAAYREIKPNNARLKLLAEHAFAEGDQTAPSRFHPEQLLWMPPTAPAYTPGGPFAGSSGYSKILVFSMWQFVPKMAASLLSYEAERRTVAKAMRGKPDYFAKNRISPRLQFRNAQGGTPGAMSLLSLLYPSRTLAECFPCEIGLSARKAAITASRLIRRKLAEARLPNPKAGRADERWYYLAPMLLDGQEEAKAWCQNSMEQIEGTRSAMMTHFRALEKELDADPATLGPRPEDLSDVLADMALGSPAVCLLRAGFQPADAFYLADVFRNHFNTPEAIGAIDSAVESVYPKRDDDAHWRNVLLYGRDGCLQSVLDEYLFLLGGPSDEAVDNLATALAFRTTSYSVDTFEALKNRIGGGTGRRAMSLRTHFASAFAEGDGDGGTGVERRESLRTAFNSPFRPFVLVSTSIGQEGLDFHRYCRKVFHWNLPHNPLDLEQREGRIDRWRSLAVRQNVAARFPSPRNWEERFAAAEAAGDRSGLIPNWRSGSDAPCRIERIVPLYACSRDEDHYRTLVDILARFRMAIGQPDQETLLARFQRLFPDPARLRNLFLDLCPFPK
jgi:hypothetical protein